MAPNTLLDMGKDEDPVFEIRLGVPILNLIPFLKLTQISLLQFLGQVDTIVPASKQLKEILKTSLV